jgi:hypothetical protein
LSALADGFNAVCTHHRSSVGFTEQQLEAVARAVAAADRTPNSNRGAACDIIIIIIIIMLQGPLQTQ